MSTSKERYDAIADNYQSALNNQATDMANATTEAEISAILANVHTAGHLFFSVTAEELTTQSQAVEADFNAAKQANQAVADARDEEEAIPTLLGKLTKATDAAKKLIDSAKA